MTLILGIDDSGRGPLIGPMILSGVLMEKKDEELLKRRGVNDSKQILHPKRIELSKLIKEKAIKFHIVKAFPEEIDSSILGGINLNTLEAKKTAEIINELNTARLHKEKIKVIVDCPSVNTKAWRNTLLGFIKHIGNLEVLCEHKADANHISVSAASILAKVTREEEVEKIKSKYKSLGNMGSGYPSDPYTIAFAKEHGKALEKEGIFRKSWKTWKTMFGEKQQKTLDGF